MKPHRCKNCKGTGVGKNVYMSTTIRGKLMKSRCIHCEGTGVIPPIHPR